MSQSRILVVDDDPQIQRMLRAQLSARGYQVQVVDNGPDALMTVADEEPDLVLLDLGLVGMDGLDVCRQLRMWSAVPVVLLTVTDDPETKVTALDLGADDYLTKPFHMAELLARMRAVRRRAASGDPTASVIRISDLVIDLAQREVRRAEEELPLTRLEFDLLRELATHAGKVLTYTHLLNAVWGPGVDDAHLVHVHVSNLRRKIESSPPGPRLIRSVPGVGYRIQPPN